MPVQMRTAADRFAVGFTEFVLRFRYLVVLAAFVVVAAIASQAQFLSFGNNYRVFFSDENPELQAFENFQNTYTKNDNVFVLVLPRDGRDVFDPEVMAAVAEITEGGWQIPHSIRVDSITNFQYTYADGDDLIVEDLIADPESLTPEEYAEKREIALAEPLLNGQIVTDNARATAVNIVIQYPELSVHEVPNVAAAARALKERVSENHPAVHLRLTGVGMLNVSFAESGQKDYSTLVPAMFGLVVLLTLFTVRSLTATFAVLLVIMLSVMVTMGAGGMMRVALTPISLSSAVVVLTLAVADSIHVLLTFRQNMRRGMPKREALIHAMRVNFLAVGITSLTTIVGFMALNASDAPPFWHLGNMSAAGIAAAWALSVTLLPALLMILHPKAKAKEVAEGERPFELMGVFADFVLARKNTLAIGTLAVSVLMVAMIPRLDFNDQWVEYFDERIPFRPASDLSSEYFGLYPVEFSVPAGETGGVSEPEYLERLDAFTRWLRAQEHVNHVYSVSDIMKRLNKNLNADDPSFYRLPDDRELSAQYLLLYELSLPYGLDLNDRINIDKSASRVTATLGNVTTAETKAFLARANAYIEAQFPEELRPVPTSTQVMFTYITDRNVTQMIQGTVLAIVLISGIMIVALRSVKLGILSLIPNALPILTAFGIWTLLVGEIGFSIAVVAAISLGIVVDDTVHLMTKYVRARRENGLSPEQAVRYAFTTVGAAIVVNTVILTIGFSLLTFSTFKVTVDMGLLTGLSIVCALILDFLFLPALLIWTDSGDTQTFTTETPHAPENPSLA